MEERFMEEVYDTLKGVLIPQARVVGVENAFEPGGECERAYSQMLDAYERLCQLRQEQKLPMFVFVWRVQYHGILNMV